MSNFKKINKIALIEARFYSDIADGLANGAINVAENNGFLTRRINVPGVFEIPATLNKIWNSGSFIGVVALGCVIRGETDHYDHICREVSRALMDLSVNNNIPMGFGVLTCENYEQAKVRSSIKERDIGGRATLACIEMIRIMENS
jgi:6,7-dimethyl-8-ribityllumazine synthase